MAPRRVVSSGILALLDNERELLSRSESGTNASRTRSGRSDAPDAEAPVVRLKVLALAATALASIPGGAHLFEFLNKIGTDRDTYFVMQQIYAGWAWFGLALFGSIAANLALSLALRRDRIAARMAAAAAGLIAASLVVFFVWTYPVNQATDNWTTMPADWQRLRFQWEVSHAVNACLMFVAFLTCSIAAAMGDCTRRR